MPRISNEALHQAVEHLNEVAGLSSTIGFRLDPGPMGRVRLMSPSGQAVIGVPTPFGMGSMPRSEFIRAVEYFTAGVVYVRRPTSGIDKQAL